MVWIFYELDEKNDMKRFDISKMYKVFKESYFSGMCKELKWSLML